MEELVLTRICIWAFKSELYVEVWWHAFFYFITLFEETCTHFIFNISRINPNKHIIMCYHYEGPNHLAPSSTKMWTYPLSQKLLLTVCYVHILATYEIHTKKNWWVKPLQESIVVGVFLKCHGLIAKLKIWWQANGEKPFYFKKTWTMQASLIPCLLDSVVWSL